MESGAVWVLVGIVGLVHWAWLAVRDVKRQRRRLPPPYTGEILAESASDERAEVRRRGNELVP